MPLPPAAGPAGPNRPEDDPPIDPNAFYAPPAADEDDEYDVEPVDEQVLASERARAAENVRSAESAIDVDAIYREMERGDDFDAAFENFRARFTIKHLLILMTVVAVVLGVAGSGLLNGVGFAGFIALSLIVLGGAHAYLNFRESRRREALVAARARELRRRRRASGDGDGMYTAEEEELASYRQPTFGEDFRAAMASLTRFGTGELLMAMTGAAVLLALLVLAGNPTRAAAGLGVLAIMGFGLQAADVDLPRPVLLAWWFCVIGFALLMLLGVVLNALEVTLGIGFFGPQAEG
ncbi:hypothetical protein [Botrimarina sp.]|uniref:hypothetical protein n=1 Tax=Botrimarina sp. TaxID=2795802 RepID=UPI0032EC2EAD